MRIVILTSLGSQYEALNYFSLKLADALSRTEHEIIPYQGLDFDKKALQKIIEDVKPHLLITFFTHRDDEGKNISEQLEFPTLFYTVDSFDYFIESMGSPYQITSVRDHFSYHFLKENVSKKVLFLPHAVEKELNVDPNSYRPYPVVFLGTCFDESVGVKAQDSLPTPFKECIDNAIEHNFNHPELDYHDSLTECLKTTPGITPELIGKYNLTLICLILEIRLRVIDRIKLLESIHDTEVHLFGHGFHNLNSWKNQFKHKSNFVFHDPVTFQESIEIMKQAKIVLNSAPQVHTGSHERVFYSLASGALPLTTQDGYNRANFNEKEDILTYPSNHWTEAEEKIKLILNDEPERIARVKKGQAIVQKFHTWDVRAAELISQIKTFLTPGF